MIWISSWSEYSISIVFLLVVILWLTQSFGDTRGWTILFLDEYVLYLTIDRNMSPNILADTSLMARLLYLVGCFHWFYRMLILLKVYLIARKSNYTLYLTGGWKYAPIVQWNNLARNLSWGVIFLLGAGLAVAAAFTVCLNLFLHDQIWIKSYFSLLLNQSSGLSETVAKELRFLANIPRAAVIIIVIIISGLFTEVTSNTSTASIFLPVLDSVVCFHDFYFILNELISSLRHVHPVFILLFSFYPVF